MKLTIQILYFVASLLVIFKRGEAAISYGSLIENVYNEYKTFCIIIAANKNYFSLEKMTTLQKLSRNMSARGIGSVVVNFGKLEAAVKFHHSETARPLVVIFLDGMTEVREFRNEILTMDMSYPVWLMLFTGNNDRDSCEYCRSPNGNPFNLEFDTEMLVSCCNSNYIAKWSPGMMNYTNTLSRDEGIKKAHEILSHHRGTLHNHSKLVNIKEPCIVIVKGSASIRKKNNELHGYVGEIITELSRVMNFNLSCIMEESTYGAFDPKTSMWTGAIGAVMQGRADIGASKFSMTSLRREVVDFTTSIGNGKSGFYYRNPHYVLIEWTGFLKVFHQNVWLVIIILLLITPLLLTIIQYTRKDNLLDIICKNYLEVWGLFCQQGSSDSVQEGPLRMIYFAILISSIIVSASYSAALIRHLTTSSERALFHNETDFIKDGTYKLIVLKNASNHQWIESNPTNTLQTNNSTKTQQLRRLLKPKDSLPTTRKEAFDQVCKEKVAFFDNQAGAYVRGNDVPCAISSFHTGGMFHVGMILPLNSKYKELVNYHLQQFRKHGILDRLRRKYSQRRSPAEISYTSVTFRDVLPILTIFAAGCSIAFMIFYFENY